MRSILKVNASYNPVMQCPICGIDFDPTVHHGGWQKRYCSRRCLSKSETYRMRINYIRRHAVFLFRMAYQMLTEAKQLVDSIPGHEMGLRFPAHQELWDWYHKFKWEGDSVVVTKASITTHAPDSRRRASRREGPVVNPDSGSALDVNPKPDSALDVNPGSDSCSEIAS